MNQTLRDTGCLPSVAVRSEREVVRTNNTRGNILEMVKKVHGCPLVEWPLASAYHVCRFGELYMKNIYIPNMIKGYNIWNQASATQSLLMRTENCQATGGGHFENLL